MTEITIYSLVDPASGEVRYIGKSKHPARRFSEHVKDAERGKTTPLACWIKSLRKKGQLPVMRVVMLCGENDWQNCEIKTIEKFLKSGSRLLNLQAGGQGLSDPTGVIAEKIRTTNIAKGLRPGSGGTKKGDVLSQETRKKMSASHKRIGVTDHQLSNLEKGRTLKKSPEHRQKISDGLKARHAALHQEETR